MDQLKDVLERIAQGQTVDHDSLPAEVRPMVDAAQSLATQGREITPPAGAFARARTRAAAAPRRLPSGLAWLRPAMVAAMVALVVTGLGSGAYASTPGEPLFYLQRAVDDAYLILPRNADDSAKASLSIANRRVSQAVEAAKTASPDAIRLALSDAVRYLARARADISKLSGEQRHDMTSGLAAFERASAQRLKDARNEQNGPNNDNDQVLQEIESQLDKQAEDDNNDGSRGGQTEPGKSPTQGGSGPGASDQGSQDGTSGHAETRDNGEQNASYPQDTGPSGTETDGTYRGDEGTR